ncbi:hypothetical protein RND81_07G134600 [Saponaria officinalis]|uniref:AAA+ ATPase domain-containing protein n=1 Tax=Saponaria officinalis TaxID=3572 RepID=A0AAW1JN28_SAPOF
MAGECGVVLKVVGPIKSFLFDAVKEYVGYIGGCDDNLGALHKSLNDVCNKKDDINKKVKEGNDKQEEITREAASWLKDVRLLADDEELKGLMYIDMETAKFVVKMMGKKDLKRRLSEESEMQDLVIRVMKKLKEEMENSEEEDMRKMMEVDYKKVAEVLVEVMKDTIDEFKKLMKEDRRMAVIATRTLKDRDLDKLTRGDQEMEEIVRVAGNVSDEELWQNHEDEESDALLVKNPVVGSGHNTVKEAAKKLFTPLANLLTPLGRLMDDANFKKAVPEAESVKLGLEVIDGLLIKRRGSKIEMDDNTKQDTGCCCSPLSLCNDYHDRYLLSKAAEFMAKHIQDDLIGKCPLDPVTLRIRTVDLMSIPTQFLKGLDSRTKLLHRILENLNDDRINAVGVFGMGGTGKTTLAKEVNKRVKDMFSIKVMVEVSEAPDIKRIQAAIAESIDLPLSDVNSVSQRAIRLYNRLVSEKEKKVLIILDNVWTKLNLDEVGIPRTSKLLLTTRDKEVCRVMDVKDVNILEVGVMNTNEARELFKSQAGNQANLNEYKNVVERLLSKCGGVPLAIVATANTLKKKDLPSWVKFADDLEKPLSSQVTGDYRQTYSILGTSYKFIEVDEKRIFLLLACLPPLGSSVSIESLMRYGIGLKLFQHVNKLCEAMEQANTWARELVLSSMLLESDVKGDVKIHDLVRAFVISFAAKEEGHKFMVEGIPHWLDDESFKKYTAMSLISRNDCSRLSGVEAYKLQILILKGDLFENVSDLFFSGMVNLEVLALSNMNFQPSLPESMRELKKLRTLCMDGCKLGDIKQIGELVNLLVLSLRESFVEELPIEIGELCKLRLLDLTGCLSRNLALPLFPSGVLGKLTRLEGLYVYNNKQSVFETKSDDEETTSTETKSDDKETTSTETKSDDKETTSTENNRFPYLNVLEITVERYEALPIDGQSIQNVDIFRVSVGEDESTDEPVLFRRELRFNSIYELIDFLEESCLCLLLKKAEFLGFWWCSNFEHLVPLLDQEGFRDLRSLRVHQCSDIKCIVDGRTMNNLIAFPCLLSLQLSKLPGLKMIYVGEASPGAFSNLQTITLYSLDALLYGLPFVPNNIKDISVSLCESLKFLFIEEVETQTIELPFLKRLELTYVPSLVSLVGQKHYWDTSDDLQGRQIFFNGKIVLPSLENLELQSCDNWYTLWSKDVFTSGFQRLNAIAIRNCDNLSSLGPSSVFSLLVKLETLSIINCDKMYEIITPEETEEELETGKQIIRFPQLKYLELDHMSNLESFYGGGSKLEFPKLKKMEMRYLGRMNRFAKLENSSALFHEEIDFPCLEELEVRDVNDEVIGLWDMQASRVTSNPAPMLRQLTLRSTAGLRQIPSTVLENLSSLILENFKSDEVLFASSGIGENKGFVWMYSQLQNLDELKVMSCQSLGELLKKEDCSSSNDALALFCGQVKTLDLVWLPSLNMIPLHLFKGLASLSLCGLKWEYVISVDTLGDSLHQLQFLKIEHCDKMEALMINVGSLIQFPRLQHLFLSNLTSFKGFSSTPKGDPTLHLPSLESLKIVYCDSMEFFWSASIVAPRRYELSNVTFWRPSHLDL